MEHKQLRTLTDRTLADFAETGSVQTLQKSAKDPSKKFSLRGMGTGVGVNDPKWYQRRNWS